MRAEVQQRAAGMQRDTGSTQTRGTRGSERASRLSGCAWGRLHYQHKNVNGCTISTNIFSFVSFTPHCLIPQPPLFVTLLLLGSNWTPYGHSGIVPNRNPRSHSCCFLICTGSRNLPYVPYSTGIGVFVLLLLYFRL